MRYSWLAFLCLFSCNVFAVGTCYQWHYTSDPMWYDSASAAASGFVSWMNSTGNLTVSTGSCPTKGSNASVVYSLDGGVTAGTFPDASWYVNCVVTASNGSVTNYNHQGSISATTRTNPEGCPECPASGTTRIAGLVSATGGTFCMAKCKYKTPVSTLIISGAGVSGNLLMAESTGEACAQSSETSVMADSNECMSVAGVGYVCADLDSGKDCASVAGDRVCVKHLQSGCVGYDSGGVACVSTVGAPPKPDNGTPGTPATSDVDITYGSQIVNYFTSTTVNNSSSEPTTTGTTGGDPSKTGDSGTGGSDGDSDCSGDDCHPGESASGGGDCSAAPSCDGNPIACAQVHQQWLQRCPGAIPESELSAAIGTVADIQNPADVDVGDGSSSFSSTRFGTPAPACPEPITLNVMGQSITYDPYSKMCEAGSMYRVIALMFFYLAAARIVIGKL